MSECCVCLEPRATDKDAEECEQEHLRAAQEDVEDAELALADLRDIVREGRAARAAHTPREETG
jgi:hypothetical protein